MNLDSFRLLAPLGSGSDAMAYRAQRVSDGSAVEIRVLNGARAHADRWTWLTKRLRRVALLTHPGAVQIRTLGLEHDPPFVALEWVEGNNLADEFHDRVPVVVSEAVTLACEVVAVLTAAHRLGLTHAHLGAGTVRRSLAGLLKVDFTGIEAYPRPERMPLASPDPSQAPRPDEGATPDPALDVYGIGALLYWLLTGELWTLPAEGGDLASAAERTLPGLHERRPDLDPHLVRLMHEMLAANPGERPLAEEVEDRLLAVLGDLGRDSRNPDDVFQTIDAPSAGSVELLREQAGRVRFLDQLSPALPTADMPAVGRQLGRFHLRDKLGQGGMGAVYRAEDLTDGRIVAIKVLHPDWARRPEALRRFHKEARLLAEVNNPYVTNLLEVNQENGVPYLVLEFVAGQSLGQLLKERGRLDERLALAIIADATRALVEAHERGIVHRDIKPDNILLQVDDGAKRSAEAKAVDLPGFRVKLSDFGLARHVVESESLNLTQAGALMGTPLYMAPEQCSGGAVDPRTDVYALGATLFHLLAGRPPFLGDTPLALATQHCYEAPPSLQNLNDALSAGVCQVVEKALAKLPEARYANAGSLLRDLERLLRGEPASIVLHPQPPACDPDKILRYQFVWELKASPQQLWPYISNTERLNRAAGLPAVQFTSAVPEGGEVAGGQDQDLRSSLQRLATRPRRFGRFRKAGITVAWEEHPFEWVEMRRMGVLREYRQGPFQWLVSVTDLQPRPGGGTTLTHEVRLEPRGLLGRAVAAVEVGMKGRRALDHIYCRIDAILTEQLPSPALVDPFEEPAKLAPARRRRLHRLLDRLVQAGVDPAVVDPLGRFLAQASAQEVARIRPLALARRLALDPQQVVAACLHGAREGLLVLLWDILCPVCRIPSQVQDTLRALREHGHCEACNLEFELDFTRSVEMIFRAHPEVRITDLGTYCVSGPAHSPHVAAQICVGSRERIELELSLPEGDYRLRGPQLPFALEFQVRPRVAAHRWDLTLSHGPGAECPHALGTGGQVLALTNDYDREVVVRIERTAPRDDVLTAARASTLPLFRELFPEEVLAAGQLVSVATVTFLVTVLDRANHLYDELGDARAFNLIHEHFRLLGEDIRRGGGALVKTVGEGVVAVFNETTAAVRVGLGLQALLSREEATQNLRLRIGIHSGPALATTLNDHLDYFGTAVSQAMQLPQWARGGELLLTPAVAAEPGVSALLRKLGFQGELVSVDLPGLTGEPVQRLVLPGAGSNGLPESRLIPG